LSDQRMPATKHPCFVILVTFQLKVRSKLMDNATVSAASCDVETIRAPTFRAPDHILMQGLWFSLFYTATFFSGSLVRRRK
jgi:hypothetical protein